MNSQPERVPQGTGGTLEPLGPSLIVKIVMRPMTKMLNPLIVKLAGRRHFAMAAQIRHVGLALGPHLHHAGQCQAQRRHSRDRAHVRQSVRLVAERQGGRRSLNPDRGRGLPRHAPPGHEPPGGQAARAGRVQPCKPGRLPHARHQAGHDPSGGVSRASARRGSHCGRRIDQRECPEPVGSGRTATTNQPTGLPPVIGSADNFPGERRSEACSAGIRRTIDGATQAYALSSIIMRCTTRTTFGRSG